MKRYRQIDYPLSIPSPENNEFCFGERLHMAPPPARDDPGCRFACARAPAIPGPWEVSRWTPWDSIRSAEKCEQNRCGYNDEQWWTMNPTMNIKHQQWYQCHYQLLGMFSARCRSSLCSTALSARPSLMKRQSGVCPVLPLRAVGLERIWVVIRWVLAGF